MALVAKFDLVYRDGAAEGAPVNSLKVFEYYTEIPSTGVNIGDLAFAKDLDAMYLRKGGYWTVLIDQFFANFRTNIIVDQAFATLLLGKIGFAAKTRLMNNSEFDTATALTINLSPWFNKDDINKMGLALLMNSGGFSFHSSPTGIGTVSQVANISPDGGLTLAGGIRERNRTNALGGVVNVTFNSNNYSAGTMTITVSSYLAHYYSISGDILSLQVWVEGVLGGTPTNGIYVNIGNNIASAGYSTAVGRIQNVPVLVYSTPGVQWVTISKFDGAIFTATAYQMVFDIDIRI